MSEHLSSEEQAPAAGRYWPAAEFVSALEQYESGQEGTTDLEYIEWVQDVIQNGLSGNGLLQNARQLEQFSVTGDDFGTDVERQVQPVLAALAIQLRTAYRDGATATIEELNLFIASRPGLLRLAREDGDALLRLETSLSDKGVLQVAPRGEVLYVDTQALPEAYRQALNLV